MSCCYRNEKVSIAVIWTADRENLSTPFNLLLKRSKPYQIHNVWRLSGNINNNLHVSVDPVHGFFLTLTEQTHSTHWESLPIRPVTAHNTALKPHDHSRWPYNECLGIQPMVERLKQALTHPHPPSAPCHPQTALPPRSSPAPAHKKTCRLALSKQIGKTFEHP